MKSYRIDSSKGMEFGLYSLGDHVMNPFNGEHISAEQRIQAENSQDAVEEMYPHLNAGMHYIRGTGYPKGQVEDGPDRYQALMVGSPQQIIEKMLYQYELYGHQRFMAQIDFGGVPFEKIMKNIELIATEIMPAVKKYTKA